MNVTQLIGKNGKGIANQFIIQNDNEVALQSYDSKIATYNKQEKTLKLYGELWDYSNTTRKHFSQFINDFTCFGYDTKSQFIELINTMDRIITIS